jgi:hypothetical protein
MAAENLEAKYQQVVQYADVLIDRTLENIEKLSKATSDDFAAMVFQYSALNMLLINCTQEYERRGYKGLEEIVSTISDAIRVALTDCKPTTH